MSTTGPRMPQRPDLETLLTRAQDRLRQPGGEPSQRRKLHEIGNDWIDRHEDALIFYMMAGCAVLVIAVLVGAFVAALT